MRGDTAYNGSIFPRTWTSNPGKIPETIVESHFTPANPTGWDLWFRTKVGMVLPGDSEQTEWFAEKGTIPWRLHKVHSETKVTYSYGLAAGVVFLETHQQILYFLHLNHTTTLLEIELVIYSTDFMARIYLPKNMDGRPIKLRIVAH